MGLKSRRHHDPKKVRAVLRFLFEHPWSSREEIAAGCGIATQTLSAIMKDELRLRSKRHAVEGGGRPREVFALPDVPNVKHGNEETTLFEASATTDGYVS